MISDSDEKEKSSRLSTKPALNNKTASAEAGLFESGCFIKLTHGKYAKVDPELHAALSKHTWEAQKSAHLWYAVRREIRGGKVFRIKMHRQIAGTPPGLVCHHKNGRGLDNRMINLDNMYPLQHKTHHIIRKHQTRKVVSDGTAQAR